jgi:hypothetical protein
LALSRDGILVGGLQLILGDLDRNLPLGLVWPDLPLSGRQDAAEVALLALSKDARGLFGQLWPLCPLCLSLWRVCRARGILDLWAAVPPRNLPLYRRMGWPLRIVGPLRPHWGEECYPCLLNMDEAEWLVRERARTSPFYLRLVRLAECGPAVSDLSGTGR